MCVCVCCVSVCSAMSSEGVYPSLFMSALNSQSDRALSLCWEQHCKLLPGVQGIHASQVVAWSVDEVRPPAGFPLLLSAVLLILKPRVFLSQVFRFVQNLIGCEEQARIFKEEVGVKTLILCRFSIILLVVVQG